MSVRLSAALPLSVCLAGCSGLQSALETHGSQAENLAALIWLFTGVLTLVWASVSLVLVAALLRRRRRDDDPLRIEKKNEKRMAWTIGGAMAGTVLIIIGLTVTSFLTTRRIVESTPDMIDVKVRGFQWWWAVEYPASRDRQGFVTANELHVPVGRPVRVTLNAADVIHSFWVPSLAGKLDLIPGRENVITFTAQRAGIYRGQCAEFCGAQHAHMAFTVIADEPAAFAAWQQQQAMPAARLASAEEQMGRDVFNAKACAACHTVRGTPAAGRTGPDLTHLASRRFIAAGLLETSRGSIAAWIADPQTLKPGNNMPMVPLSADELRAVSAYMAGLE